MTTSPLEMNISVKFDANGNGRVALSPNTGTLWVPTQVRAQNTSTVQYPSVSIYTGSSTVNDQLIDTTTTNIDDTSGRIQGQKVYPGQAIIAVWSGGDANAVGTLTVYGEQYTNYRNETLPNLALGTAFPTRPNPVNPVDVPGTLISGNQNVSVGGSPASIRLGPFTVRQFVSWVINMSFITNPANNFMQMRLYWSNDTNVNQPSYTWIEDFVVDTSNLNFNGYVGHGPMYGPYMWVVFTNYDANPVTFSFNLTGSNRIVNESQVRSFTTLEPPGWGTDDVLLAWDVNNLLPGGANAQFMPVNIYNGPVTIRFAVFGATGVNTTQLQLNYMPKSDFGGNSSGLIAGPATTTGSANDQYINANFPKRPVQAVVINNQSTGNVNTRVRIVAKGAAI